MAREIWICAHHRGRSLAVGESGERYRFPYTHRTTGFGAAVERSAPSLTTNLGMTDLPPIALRRTDPAAAIYIMNTVFNGLDQCGLPDLKVIPMRVLALQSMAGCDALLVE